MSFNENDVNRDKGGKFDTKTGSAPDILLPVEELEGLPSAEVQARVFDMVARRNIDTSEMPQPIMGGNSDGSGFSQETLDTILQEDFPDVNTLNPGEEELPDISDFNPHAETPLPDIELGPMATAGDEVTELDRQFVDAMRNGTVYTIATPKLAPTDLNGFEVHAQQNLQQVTELLNSGNLADNGITTDDLSKLRGAIDRAEYNLVDNAIRSYLDANHPEVKGILIESDSYDSPSFIGVEIDDGTETPDGRNYGTVIPFDERYSNLYNHLYNHSEDIAQFQDRGSFDEFATVLTDDTEQFGRFRGLYENEPMDAPVYRIAARD